MLIVSDIHELGDKRLNPEEAVIRLKEENLALAAKFKINGQSELEDAVAAVGEPMDWRELIFRLSRLNTSLMFRDGSPGQIAVYVPKNRQELAEEEYDYTRPGWHNASRYVTGFPKQRLPEFSSVTTDERGLAKREIRGWRSVVLALVKSHVITYRQAVTVFGEPSGPRASRWFLQTRSERYAS